MTETDARTPLARSRVRSGADHAARPTGRALARRAAALAVGVWLFGAAGLWPVGAEASHLADSDVDHEAGGEPDSGGEVVLVAADGDTVWSLVLPHAPAGADPHEFVEEVAARSGVDPAGLRPGDVLRVPVR